MWLLFKCLVDRRILLSAFLFEHLVLIHRIQSLVESLDFASLRITHEIVWPLRYDRARATLHRSEPALPISAFDDLHKAVMMAELPFWTAMLRAILCECTPWREAQIRVASFSEAQLFSV